MTKNSPSPSDDDDAKPPAAEVIMRLARDGVVTGAALVAAGLTPQDIARQVKARLLTRVKPGIFVLAGSELRGRTALRAALAINSDGAISLWSSAHLHGLCPQPPKVHLTVPNRGHMAPDAWYHPHSTRRLEPREVTTRSGIRVTTVARTIRDMAELLPHDEASDAFISRLIEEALLLRRTTVGKLDAFAEAEASPILRRRLQRLLARQRGRPDLLRSKGERWLRDFIARRGLPMPEFNAMVEGCEVDAAWHKERLIAEFDGFWIHNRPTKFSRDRQRDRRMLIAGWNTTRITDDDHRDPDRLERDIVRLLTIGPPQRAA